MTDKMSQSGSHQPIAVVLLSGGLDSATCAAQAIADGYQVIALSIDYGQRHQKELLAAKAIALSLAEAQSASAIYLGINAVDYSGCPDLPPGLLSGLSAASHPLFQSQIRDEALRAVGRADLASAVVS